MGTSSLLTVNARPHEIEVDPKKSAVIVVDMQNEFGSKGGMFDRAGIDISIIRATIEPTERVLKAARTHGIPVIYLAMQHREDLADMGGETSPHRIKHQLFGVGDSRAAPDGSPNRVLVAGYWGTEIIPELTPQPGDRVVAKHRYSGFFETPLDGVLRGLQVETLFVTGCTTSVCVESTVRDAMFRGYTCCVLSDCVAEPIGHGNMPSNHDASLLNIELLFGWVSDSEALLGALTN